MKYSQIPLQEVRALGFQTKVGGTIIQYIDQQFLRLTPGIMKQAKREA